MQDTDRGTVRRGSACLPGRHQLRHCAALQEPAGLALYRCRSLCMAWVARQPPAYVYCVVSWYHRANAYPATADLLSGLLKNATAINPKARVRGCSSNVSNYNGLAQNGTLSGYDELVYYQYALVILCRSPLTELPRNLAPLLSAAGFPAHVRNLVPYPRSHLTFRRSSSRTRDAQACRVTRARAATGATISLRASAGGRRRTRRRRSSTRSCGSSLARRVTGRATRPRRALTPLATPARRFFPRPRLATGSRRTSSSCSRTQTRHSRRFKTTELAVFSQGIYEVLLYVKNRASYVLQCRPRGFIAGPRVP
jgi:hypothetical protein